MDMVRTGFPFKANRVVGTDRHNIGWFLWFVNAISGGVWLAAVNKRPRVL